jgi:electron transport complex protein RnfD
MIFLYKPQINLSYSTTARIWFICACAFFCILQSSFTDEGRSLYIALSTVSFAVLTEFLLTRRKWGLAKIKDGSAVATALVLAILLPNQLHPIYAALGSMFAIIVVKYSFGGLGSNWLNPALGGWLFIRFSWFSAFTDAMEDSVISITEMVNSGNLSPIDNSTTEFLNNSVFSFTGVQIPSGYIDLLFNVNPGIITDRGLFVLLIGTILITAVGINRGWMPLVFLGVYGFLIRFAGDLYGSSGLYWNGDILYGIFSGGTIATAFILAAEPSSSAKLKPGILFSVILIAVLSWFFRYVCMEYTGCFIALALVNCITPVIRLAEDKMFFPQSSQLNREENPYSLNQKTENHKVKEKLW